MTALADAMNMSRSTLTRKLKAITGRTPLDFIRNIKMKHARHMLEDKDKSVTEVAATLGYFNRKYFTTCFKEEFGMTPSEFQKSQHEEFLFPISFFCHNLLRGEKHIFFIHSRSKGMYNFKFNIE